MKRWSPVVTLVGGAALALLLAPPGARGEGVRPCKKEAKREYRECKRDCREGFQLAKDTCVKRDHDCVEVCRAVRHDCRQPHVEALRAAIAACNATLDGARQECRDLYPDGTPERDACIDQAQVVAFKCRDQARENARPHLRACRKKFRSCVRENCPPGAPVSRDEIRACKRDAKQLFKICLADCRESFQLAKDTCLDRDHACVEQCRTERQACRQPFVDQRSAAIAICNATRDAAIQNCRDLYPLRTPERDACIDQAQVEAFQCRDAAREAVAADLRVCREAFRACAGGCPPPGGSPGAAFLDVRGGGFL